MSELFITGLLGLVFGSFISMLSWRLPRIMFHPADEQLKAISLGGSHCPKCESRLAWYQLIPLSSWLVSLGRCQTCKQPISWRYPLIEISATALALLAVWQFGFNMSGLIGALFLLWLLTISVIDLEHHLILDNLSLPLLWVGLLLNAFGQFTDPQQAILGAVFGYGILWLIYQIHFRLTGKHGMGYGDFKLTAALGAWFGVSALPQIIVVAAISSLVIAVLLIMTRKQAWQSHMAFGPFLAIGGAVQLFAGEQALIEWLLKFA